MYSLYYTIEMTSDLVQITIKSYDQTVDQYVENVSPQLMNQWHEKFMELLPKNGRILDLGCGFGRDVEIFAEHGFESHGIDLSSNMIARAKAEVLDGKFLVQDIRDPGYEDSYFDGLWARASLLHIPKAEIANTLQKWSKLINNKGILFLNIKKGSGEGLESDTRYQGQEKFWSYFSETEIIDFLQAAGFNILEKKTKASDEKYNAFPFLCFLCQAQ